jgi:hypothetical protein
VTREEPRRWDWWLAGCAVLAAILIAVDAAAVLSDDAAAGPAPAPRTNTAATSSSSEAAVHTPASRVPVSYAGRSLAGECEGFLVRVSVTGPWTSAARPGPC